MSELSNCCGAETIPLKGYPPTCSKCGQEQPASPPVVGDVREKILICLEVMLKAYQAKVNGRITSEEFKEAVLAFPGSILQIIHEAGYVKLRKGEHISSGSINDKGPVIGTDLSGNPLIRKEKFCV